MVFSGGGYQLYSDVVYQVVFCLCGSPIPLKRLNRRTPSDLSLIASLEAARGYRERTGSDQAMAELKRDFITNVEFQELTEQVRALEDILQQMQNNEQHDAPQAPK